MRHSSGSASALLLALPLALGPAIPAAAQAVDINRIQFEELTNFELNTADLYEHCGREIIVGIDWSSFTLEDITSGFPIHRYCQGAADAVRELCRDEAYQETMRENVFELRCAIGDTQAAFIDEDWGIYYYTFSWNSTDMIDWHIQFLKNNL
ncbi:MAG: hypothetical protein ACFBRM_08390 [Pikeienuella sp.]